MTSVLYDLPGPKALARHRIFGVAAVIVALGIVGFVVFRFWQSGQFSAQKWSLFSYTAVWERVGDATIATLAAFGLAAVASLVLGLVLALGRLSDHAWVRAPFTAFIELFRAVPLLILIMIFYYGLRPLGFDFLTPYWSVVLGLTLYNGSVLAEVFRAGVNALPKGQTEAGYAIGLRKGGVMSLILLPQAFRSMLPVIIAQLVVVLKDTALGFIVTYQELLFTAKFFSNQVQFESPIIPVTIVVAVIYIGMCLILSGIAKYVELRLRGGGRRKPKKSAPSPEPAEPASAEARTAAPRT